MVDQAFYGQSQNLLNQSLNGHKLVKDDLKNQFHTNITQETTVNVVMWEMPHNIVDWVFAKTQAGDLEVSKSTSAGIFYVFLEVVHLFLLVGCARSRRVCHAAPQDRTLLHWMPDCEWKVFLLWI